MFIRKREGKYQNTYQIIETYREDGKVKQRVIFNLRGWESINKMLERWQELIIIYEDFKTQFEGDKDRDAFDLAWDAPFAFGCSWQYLRSNAWYRNHPTHKRLCKPRGYRAMLLSYKEVLNDLEKFKSVVSKLMLIKEKFDTTQDKNIVPNQSDVSTLNDSTQGNSMEQQEFDKIVSVLQNQIH